MSLGLREHDRGRVRCHAHVLGFHRENDGPVLKGPRRSDGLVREGR
eukprot:SAG11_NODE_2085_length_3847_cov_2.866329_3_plen_46_part_00